MQANQDTTCILIILIKTEYHFMKLTDTIARTLKEYKIKHVFGLQGGAAVHIFDSLEKNKIGVTYTNHEQSAALAAVAYAKATNHIGCVVVTTGPATTNTMTGLLSAWQDSVPCIFISGQSRSQHTSYGKKVRQVGTQEVNICDIVRPITKYVKFIDNKDTFLDELNKAITIANSGRKGPVWIDLPLEFQWADISLKKKKIPQKTIKFKNLKLSLFNNLVKKSKKPLFIIGYGVRSSKNAHIELKKTFSKKNIPFVTTWNAYDLFSTNDKMNLGLIGMSGHRGANKAVFESDLLICLGTHLSIPHTTTLFDDFAPNSKKIIINIDRDQLKNLNVKFDLKINSDLNYFLKKINKDKTILFNNEWNNLSYLKKINWYYPKEKNSINSNTVMREVTKEIKSKKCIILDGGGTALYTGFQSSVINKDDRIICSSAISSMGTGLAETIGVSKSRNFKKLICLIGDGSFLMNIQDLQTISQDKINVLIIVVNNNGYLAIRNTQKEFLKARYYGTHPKWKLTMPNFEKVSKAFNLKYFKFKRYEDFKQNIKKIKNLNGPTVCELFVDENQEPLFKQGYKSNNNGTFSPQPLSEMYPFLNSPIANTNN